MSELESAEDLYDWVYDEFHSGQDSIRRIKERDAAVALAVLAEVESLGRSNFELGFRLDVAFQQAMFDVRAKYAPTEATPLVTDKVPNWCECSDYVSSGVPCTSNCPAVRSRLDKEKAAT